MNNKEPCNVCGCTETELVDGFYYCTECGTQDTNVRETLIDITIVGDGVVALGSRNRITQIPKGHEIEMTDDWYKWHCINFLLKGLADELIELGAAPSFKTKLLWVWTRYMKKYQKKADFGLANEESEDDDNDIPNNTDKPYSTDEEDEEHKNSILHRNSNALYGKITKISMPLVISFLYVALNIDKSPIQLTHLFRFMREGRVSILNWQKLVPQELRPKKLKRCLFFDYQCFRFTCNIVRKLALQIFRNLDLGNPILPDLRVLIDEYLRELCLPNDIKPLVISLMHYRSFDYLNINVEYKDLSWVPSYELYVMSHILVALKMCFSLDGQYEHDVADAVDKINDMEDHPKSYNAEPTERLFSFKDWCSYIIFRKTMLKTHTLHLGAPNYFDMDDYVAFEHQRERPDYKVLLKDEIAMDILKKIPRSEINVIPRSEFYATKTPHTDYTRKIIEHQQDPEIKQLLGEDFTQYSLQYILNDMFLVDPDSEKPKNIITGICERNVINCNSLFFIKYGSKPVYSKRMVYVKNCDNHNWMTTLRPQLEHVTKAKNNEDSDEKENDYGYESNSESSQNVPKTSSVILDNTSISIAEPSLNGSVLANDNSTLLSKIEDEKIREEVEGLNIFDDDFADLDAKIEEEKLPAYNDDEIPCTNTESFVFHDTFRYNELTQIYKSGDKDSDASSEDSIGIDPETLDRNEAIKKLIIHACNKLKVSIPGQYIHKAKKVPIRKPPNYGPAPKRARVKGLITQKINNLIESYHSHMKNDILHQMSNMVQSAIADFNKTKESEMHVDLEDPPPVDAETDVANDQIMETELNNPNEEPEQNETVAEDEYKLFGDSSDGETHAEDLLPKKNPKFDEETHDSRQLYIRPVEDPGVPEMRLNPNLFKIIEKQLEADKNEINITEKEIIRSDSDEDMSLSTLQEQKRLRKQITKRADRTKTRRLQHLIPGSVPSYKYWMRHYVNEVTSAASLNQRYAYETNTILPKSFALVLKECADVVGYPPFIVYKNLQRVELYFKDKFSKRGCFKPKHFSECKKRRM